MLDPEVAELARRAAAEGPVLVLTGAGISGASGIPTFRSPEGYWTVGSAVYRPEQLATRAAFRADPEAVWGWYLHRLAVCRAAEPNAAHDAVVRLERALGDCFTLITQNVDGLQRALSTRRRRERRCPRSPLPRHRSCSVGTM